MRGGSRAIGAVVIALFLAYAALSLVHISYVVARDPFGFDAWNLTFETHGAPATVGRFFAFWREQYTHANPRLGQPVAYLAYKLVGVAELGTPVAFTALIGAIVVLGTGRWPRLRRSRDLALLVIAAGAAWCVLPQVGRNMLMRAYSTNYVYTAAVQLWWLVPLRRWNGEAVSIRRALAYGVLGVIAGACNEHTGPALIAIAFGMAWWHRRAGRDERFALAGGIGMALGFAALFFAPGQGERYGELAQQLSLPMRLVQRGLGGTIESLRAYVTYAAPLLAVLAAVVAVARARDSNRLPDHEPGLAGAAPDAPPHATRDAARRLALALAGGVVVALTMLVSPKTGSRFFIMPVAGLLAAAIGVIDVVVRRDRALLPLVALGVLASAYAAARTIPLYREVYAQSQTRMAQLAASTPGSELVLDAFSQVEESWWFIGDDLRDWHKRERIAQYLGLERVLFREPDLAAPLGIAGVRLAPLVWRGGATVAVEDGDFDLAVKDGFDVEGMRASAAGALARLMRTPGLQRFELRAVVPGIQRLALPRPRLVVARWEAGTLRAYIGKVVRKGRATTRDVVVPATLRGTGWPLYVVGVSGAAAGWVQPLDETLRYTPWGRGTYWVLACAPDECWVVAATRAGA